MNLGFLGAFLKQTVVASGATIAMFGVQTNSATNGNAFGVTMSAVPTGALLVMTWADERANQNIPTITSNPSLTWTKRVDGDRGDSEIHTATHTGGTIIVQIGSVAGGNNDASMVLFAITGSSVTLGNTAVGSQMTQPSQSLVAQTGSFVIGVTSDWAANNGASPTMITPVTSSLSTGVAGSSYWANHFWRPIHSSGSVTLGMTAPTGQDASICLLEVRAA